ncbi:hypothetical protein C8F04DRAFT_1274243 [Mycena alexandri]|uniref:CxC2-like cysteine cluster KDZ transposase-associated domain-containing protein n=1 Tax=Mycena alexandri TaxID=1745969 RepID=A0AAD6S5T7_9AGAR|nr:hypothetical protein C8F04DRAFT_1274243 [Mycena alexandri]
MNFGWFLQNMVYEAVKDLEAQDPASNDIPAGCTRAGCSNPGAHSKCLDCLGSDYLCDSCMLRSHGHIPLHQILKRWENGGFARVDLKSIGMHILLGHPGCLACVTEPHFIILDTDKPHDVAIDFCDCGVGGTCAAQLVAARLYPSSYEQPRSAITFRMVMAANADRSSRPPSPASNCNLLQQEGSGQVGRKDKYPFGQTTSNTALTAMNNKGDDDWAIDFGNLFEAYRRDADARKLEPNNVNDLIPAGEPQSWDDPSWQGGREVSPPSFLEFTPMRLTHVDGQQMETEWASMVYMHDVVAERVEMPAEMRQNLEYNDYLRNKRHKFTREERKHNDAMWNQRRLAHLKKCKQAALRSARRTSTSTTVPPVPSPRHGVNFNS